MAIRIAVVGLGGRGQDWIRAVRASKAFELAAGVDSDRAVLDTAGAKLQIRPEHRFSSLETALDQAACQAVIVATSIDCHVAACHEALSRNLAVLVEKPFTLHLDEACKLVALAAAQDTPLLVAQNYRYMRAFRTARRVIHEGRLGRVGMVVMQYYRPPHAMSPALARSRNSVLWGVGVHHLDVLRFILGQEATSVAADLYTTGWGRLARGASLQALLSMADGARVFYSATYESSGHQFFERGQEFYARFVGERATLHVCQRWLILCEGGRLPRLVRRGRRKTTEEQTLLGQLERAVLHGEAPEVSGRDNLHTVALLEACGRSAAEQRWIKPGDLLHAAE